MGCGLVAYPGAMPERRNVHISFAAPGVGHFEEQDLRTKIINKTGGGLGWEVSATNPMTVYRDFDDDVSFESALAALRELVGGPEFAREFHDLRLSSVWRSGNRNLRWVPRETFRPAAISSA